MRKSRARFASSIILVLIYFCDESQHKNVEAPEGSLLSRKLVVVGRYLSVHKFFERDQRLPPEQRDKTPLMYMYKFPIPPVSPIPSIVRDACDKDVEACLDLIYKTSFRILERKDLFIFRATASYYMCWYTMLDSPALRFFGSDCQVPFRYPNRTIDYRGWDKHPFECAMHNFCPDLCCGQYKKQIPRIRYQDWMAKEYPMGFAAKRKDCERWEGFPCSLSAHTCSLRRSANRNFRALTENKLNATCDCARIGKNYRWDPVFKMCIDLDECREGTYDCELNSICRNVESDYYCTCRLGYVFDNKRQECILDQHFTMSDVIFEQALNIDQQLIKTVPPPKKELDWDQILAVLREYFTWIVKKDDANTGRCSILLILWSIILACEFLY